MSNLYMQEESVEVKEDGKRILFYDSEVFQSRFETPSEVYKYALSKWGRCTGKVYVSTKDGKDHHIGWVFLKRAKYTDCDETYLQETWVTIHEAPAKKIIEYSPMYLS